MRQAPLRVLKYVDLFCGIGGFRVAAERVLAGRGYEPECVFACDIDESCARAYEANYGHRPSGDVTKIAGSDVPEHDLLLAGFPCQAFSIMGNGHGFMDATRGTLFFEIARIVRDKRPPMVVLENVKGLVGHQGGRTLATILETLRELGYTVDYRVLNALDFGLPQKRERVWIVGLQGMAKPQWPTGGLPMAPLAEVLEPDHQIPRRFWASEYIRSRRHASHRPASTPSIWHENKAGNISSYPYSCALRASASYNYLLVNGERRLTPREMLRLQGFPDEFRIVCTDAETRAQAGNSLPIPVAEAVISAVVDQFDQAVVATQGQLRAEGGSFAGRIAGTETEDR
jgi:DNA (cytosine-5)-methyltransferase 1